MFKVGPKGRIYSLNASMVGHLTVDQIVEKLSKGQRILSVYSSPDQAHKAMYDLVYLIPKAAEPLVMGATMRVIINEGVMYFKSIEALSRCVGMEFDEVIHNI